MPDTKLEPNAMTAAKSEVGGSVKEVVTLHDAFISYSRKDREFASRLERALERYRLPRELRPSGRSLDVFRDEDDFTGNEYYSAVSKHLAASRTLIVICSPDARASDYVNDEIRRFTAVRGPENIIPILLEGIPNNEVRLESASQQAFPDALVACLQMPLAISFRGFDPHRNRPDRTPFEDAWYSLLANLLGVERSDAEQRIKRRRERVRNAWIAGLSAISFALAGLLVWAVIERNAAAEQRDAALRSQSTFLSQMSQQQREAGQHDLAVKLALQALPKRLDRPDRPYVAAAESALYAAFAGQAFQLEFGGPHAGLDDRLLGVRISPDGTKAALNYGQQAELWSLDYGERLGTFQSDNMHSFIEQMTFSPDSNLLVVTYITQGTVIFAPQYDTNKGTVRGSLVDLVDATTGAVKTRFQIEGHEHNHVQYSPTGKLLLLATDERFVVLDGESGKPVADAAVSDNKRLTPPYRQVLFSDDERRLAALTAVGDLVEADLYPQRFSFLAEGLDDKTRAAFLTTDGSRLAVASGRRVLVYDIPSATTSELPPTSANILALANDRTHGLFALTHDGKAVSQLGGAQKLIFDPLPQGAAAVADARLELRAQRALVKLADHSIEAWDLATGARATILDGRLGADIVDMSMAHDGTRALLQGKDSRVRVWDRRISPAIVRAKTLAQGSVTATAFDSGGTSVAIGHSDGAVSVVDAETSRTLWKSPASHHGKVEHMAFDQTGKRIVTAGQDKIAIIWDVRGNSAPIRLEGHTDLIGFSAFSPNGALVVTGSQDSTFRLWDAASGMQLQLLAIPKEFLDPIHNASIVPQAVFSSDSRTVVTVTAGDGYVISQPALVWDVQTGALLHAFEHPQGSIWDIEITPDGRHLITASYDNTAKSWDLQSGKLQHVFQGQSSRVLRALPVDDGRLVVTTTAEGVVNVHRTSTGNLVHQWRVDGRLLNVAVSHDRRLLGLIVERENKHSTIEIWDPALGARLVSIPLSGISPVPLKGVTFSPDSDALLILSTDQKVILQYLPPRGQPLLDAAWNRIGGERELLSLDQRIRFALQPP